MNKLIIDGKVAVILSRDFGAGWSSWNPEHPECMFDPEIAKMVCHGEDPDKIETYARDKYGYDFCAAASDYLMIQWLPQGTKFYIEEYDGRETVVTEEKLYLTA